MGGIGSTGRGKGIEGFAVQDGKEVVAFAAGCFWGVERSFARKFKAQDIEVMVGYCGGDLPNPSYEDACSGRSGHAEAIQIRFDPAKVTFEELADFFFRMHDPTTRNRQGNDVGSQYRSSIFYPSLTPSTITESRCQTALDAAQKHYGRSKIQTTVEPMGKFFMAEKYHQQYLEKNPHGYECPTHFERTSPETQDLIIHRATTNTRLHIYDHDESDLYSARPLFNFLRLFISVFTLFSFTIATIPGPKTPMDVAMNVTVLGGLHWNENKLMLDPSWRWSVSVLAVPGMFGRVVKELERVPLFILDSIDGCHPFTIALPEVDIGIAGVVGSTKVKADPEARGNSTKSHPEHAAIHNERHRQQPHVHRRASGHSNHTVVVSLTTTIPSRMKHMNATAVTSVHIPAPTAAAFKTAHNSTITPRPPHVAPPAIQVFHFPNFFISPSPSTNWYALLPRGNCPFDVKVLNAQAAGFSGVIIHNNSSGQDVPVRMSGHTVGDRISTAAALFLTNRDGMSIKAAALAHDSANTPGVRRAAYAPLLLTISPDAWPNNSWGTEGVPKMSPDPSNSTPQTLNPPLSTIITDIVFLFLAVILVWIALMSFYLSICLAWNYFVHGSFVIIMDYGHHSDSDFDEDEDEEEVKCLEQISLPLQVVKEEEGKATTSAAESGSAGGTRDCCAICIEEFVVGSKFRQLPCKHQFHDVW
ncbi:Peptide-methionine (S)-S-oxide reductase [Phlyctochytrium planicorne]|nr:Peptide-methionine (S)-S-oxide reductase [Phlyctochytrium planicorne]